MISIAKLVGLSDKAKVVLRHLDSHGSLSPAEAQVVHRIPKVAKQIWELRQAGASIRTFIRHDAAGTRYARYSLNGA
jgi:hypothetical protein